MVGYVVKRMCDEIMSRDVGDAPLAEPRSGAKALLEIWKK